MHIQKNSLLKRSTKKPILVDTYCSEKKIKQPIVIFCHGYKGFKDWGAWDLMATQIASGGLCFVKFNFSHNGGTVNNPIDFPDLEAFGNNNYSIELDDLEDVINWSIEHYSENSLVDVNKIYLIGHSRGGGIAILKAMADKRISKLITLAGVSDFKSRFGSPEEIEQWKQNGVKYVLNGRTKQQMPHYFQFYKDFKANEKRLCIESATKHIQIPMLIIHGDEDTSVSINEAKKLHEWNPNSQLTIIQGADHVFNTRHPWMSDQLSTQLNEVCDKIIDFISK